mmetsp:Transcript_5595/g.14993  ORF Transcript_5595/g.14993 Transcript_5595/m.14993 type:complete len:224 (+) Transcript_5595:281-952(+)
MSATHIRLNERQPSASKLTLCSTFAAIIGLNTFSCRCPLDPPTVTAVLLPNTCAHTIVSASHCVGFTFPGMIELPGSLDGSRSSPMPQRGPEPSSRISFAIFISETAITFSTPWHSTSASCAASASNLFFAAVNSSPHCLLSCAQTAVSKPLRVLRPVPTAVPPMASSHTRGSTPFARSSAYSSCCAKPENSCPSVSGTASWRCVRPIFTIELNASLFAANAW